MVEVLSASSAASAMGAVAAPVTGATLNISKATKITNKSRPVVTGEDSACSAAVDNGSALLDKMMALKDDGVEAAACGDECLDADASGAEESEDDLDDATLLKILGEVKFAKLQSLTMAAQKSSAENFAKMKDCLIKARSVAKVDSDSDEDANGDALSDDLDDVIEDATLAKMMAFNEDLYSQGGDADVCQTNSEDDDTCQQIVRPASCALLPKARGSLEAPSAILQPPLSVAVEKAAKKALKAVPVVAWNEHLGARGLPGALKRKMMWDGVYATSP